MSSSRSRLGPEWGSSHCRSTSSGRARSRSSASCRGIWWRCGRLRCRPRPCGEWTEWWCDLRRETRNSVHVAAPGMCTMWACTWHLKGENTRLHTKKRRHKLEIPKIKNISEASLSLWTLFDLTTVTTKKRSQREKKRPWIKKKKLKSSQYHNLSLHGSHFSPNRWFHYVC